MDPTEPDIHGEDGALGRVRRRTVLRGAAAAGGIGLVGFGASQQGDGPVEIQLGGETSGWTVPDGFEADFIGSGPNPTLNLEAGTDYQVTWENVDGQPHNFAVLDANEDTVLQTEVISEQGATQSVTFTAEEGMAAYICEVHPVSMRGDIQFGGPQGEGGQQQAGPAFFEQGATVGVQQVAEGMTAPTDFAQPDVDGANRYVADQTGEVWVVSDDGRQEEPFIDISDRIVEFGDINGQYGEPGQEYDERGLLGIEFHPDYAENRRFFLHYSAPPDGVDADLPENWDHWEVLSEFQASDDGSTGMPDSERRLLELPSPQYNHDSGPFAFGPDGYLYFPMGDGGGANDDMYGHVDDWYEQNAGGNGQDVTDNLLGSVLRIDVDAGTGGATETPTTTQGTPMGNTTAGETPTTQAGTAAAGGQGGDRPYGIPEDNPFVGEDNPGLDEIWAYGFRNPFGVDFDSEGNFFLADAGQNLFEEASIVERGGNYGWNVKEGTHCFSTENPSDPTAITDCPEREPDEAPYDGSELVDPIVEYPHTYQGQNVGIVIIGGHRYENQTIPEIQGDYIFGEWTKDPARGEPLGRVLTATPPADFGGGGGTPTPEGQTGTPTDGNVTDGNATGGNATGMNVTGGAEAGMNATGGNATGTETPAGGAGEEVVPRDELWEMRELVFEGTQDGTLGRFVRMFGQDNDGEVYVLVNTRGVPQGDTGEVLKLVPPGEGEQLPPPQTATPTQTQNDSVTQVGNETQAEEVENETTAGNATGGNASQ